MDLVTWADVPWGPHLRLATSIAARPRSVLARSLVKAPALDVSAIRETLKSDPGQTSWDPFVPEAAKPTVAGSYEHQVAANPFYREEYQDMKRATEPFANWSFKAEAHLRELAGEPAGKTYRGAAARFVTKPALPLRKEGSSSAVNEVHLRLTCVESRLKDYVSCRAKEANPSVCDRTQRRAVVAAQRLARSAAGSEHSATALNLVELCKIADRFQRHGLDGPDRYRSSRARAHRSWTLLRCVRA